MANSANALTSNAQNIFNGVTQNQSQNSTTAVQQAQGRANMAHDIGETGKDLATQMKADNLANQILQQMEDNAFKLAEKSLQGARVS